jgi:hypothetical protein
LSGLPNYALIIVNTDCTAFNLTLYTTHFRRLIDILKVQSSGSISNM